MNKKIIILGSLMTLGIFNTYASEGAVSETKVQAINSSKFINGITASEYNLSEFVNGDSWLKGTLTLAGIAVAETIVPLAINNFNAGKLSKEITLHTLYKHWLSPVLKAQVSYLDEVSSTFGKGSTAKRWLGALSKHLLCPVLQAQIINWDTLEAQKLSREQKPLM
ncbi:MAG: hypothetical protein LBU35_03300 [Holosporales bacterium]|jgi:hypothetical protein|nr:hypothetical protein [Holosporales bacterium]